MAKEVIVTTAKKNTIGRFVLISWINLRMSVLTNRDVIGGGGWVGIAIGITTSYLRG
jgi:hypothetical protein